MVQRLLAQIDWFAIVRYLQVLLTSTIMLCILSKLKKTADNYTPVCKILKKTQISQSKANFEADSLKKI